jgi:hypothetical protein
MSQSLSKVYVHITFSTKNHQPYIDDTIEISLFEYIAPASAPSGLIFNLLTISQGDALCY